jgi:predicted NBD/HSP70 family sugar kinase
MSTIAGGGPGPGRVGADVPARPDAVRRHNLARLLAEVHLDGELSRAELTARLGLNRSTIGTLVGELVNLGLLEGSAPDVAARSDLSAGRPSHRVRPRADGPFVLAVDIEVDRVAVAAVGIGGVVLRRDDRATRSRRPAAVAKAVARGIERVVSSTPGFPVGIGVSVPGSVDRETGAVTLAPNLEWFDVEFAALLRDDLVSPVLSQLPISVGNDANLGAVSEQLRGRGRGHQDLVFLLGRIGVGAGIIADTHLLAGSAGAAGEVGHLSLAADGPRCHCGSRGCAEVYIGDAALLAAAGRPGDPVRTAVDAVLDDAAAGVPDALEAVRTVGRHLGRTIAALLNLVNPSVVIAGGTLARVVEVAGDETREELERYAFGRAGAQVQLGPAFAEVGDACLLGAAELAFTALLRDPSSFGPLGLGAAR